ncbi:hypothetical protein ElyMa_005198700 [Elysia marginata]|uniref:Uncharacterized protein n=1 Tax=Elysia marginata TaxID=1093978 RepID=A0AAV4JX99_9GAST|nr:hypothetical protein ElyMa_005198700 [Elysia marginata]
MYPGLCQEFFESSQPLPPTQQKMGTCPTLGRKGSVEEEINTTITKLSHEKSDNLPCQAPAILIIMKLFYMSKRGSPSPTQNVKTFSRVFS